MSLVLIILLLNFLATIFAGVEPKSFKQAMLDPPWREAMAKEIDTLEQNNTWTFKTLPRTKRLYLENGYIALNIILMVQLRGSKHVLSCKKITKLRELIITRLSFSMTSVRTFPIVVVAENWDLYQLNVNNAFLHGGLAKEVYSKTSSWVLFSTTKQGVPPPEIYLRPTPIS